VSFSQQNDAEIADSIKANFDYKTLSLHRCSDFPTGVYSVIFSLDKNLKPINFNYSIDTLVTLNNLIKEAIQKTNFQFFNQKERSQFILVIYLNVYAHCIDTDNNVNDGQNMWKAASLMQSKMLKNIEASFQKIQHSKNITLLPPLIIVNKLSNGSKNKIDNLNK
jgi:hypothetical protein